MKTTSYWLAEPREELASGPASGPVDVVVVGGGVTGCACALALAERGLSVRLYEAREVAGGASGRNGGFALRGGAMPFDVACDTIGHDRAQLLWALSETALDRLESLAGDAFRRCGSVRVAASEDEAHRLEREFEALRVAGFDVEWSEPARGYARAFLNPRDGAIHPARWVRRLAARAVGRGAELVEGAPLDPDELASLDAAAIVLATDGLTAAVVPELIDRVWPVRGQMLVTEPLAERLYERPHYARDGFDYWQQLPDGRLAIGGRRDVSFATEDTAVEETTQRVQLELEQLAAELVGGPVEVTHRWAGIWGQTADRLPLAGRLDGRHWIAAGYSGHGNVLGLACGELVARAIAGEPTPELALFDPGR